MPKRDIMPEIGPTTAGIVCVFLAVVGWGIGVNGAIIATILSIAFCICMVYGTMEFNAFWYAGMLICNVVGLGAGWIVYLIYHGWTIDISWAKITLTKWLLP